MDQQDGGNGGVAGGGGGGTGTGGTTLTIPTDMHLIKKRKHENVFTINTVSDSSDEGLGSMSPEPISLLAVGKTTTTNAMPKEIVDLKNLLEVERRQKAALEERLRQIELQIFPEGPIVQSKKLKEQQHANVAYQHQEVIEHTNHIHLDDDANADSLTSAGNRVHNVRVACHSGIIEHLPEDVCVLDDNSQTDSMDEDEITSDVPNQQNMMIKEEYLVQDSSRPGTPIETIIVRQPILEAVIKAEPKVEVERINAPTTLIVRSADETFNTNSGSSSPSTVTLSTTNNPKQLARQLVYMTAHNTSRQNLETIVEAIRHLEGDQLFGEMTEPTQEVPLALTNKPVTVQPARTQLQLEMNPFLQFRPNSDQSQPQQQQPHQQIIVQQSNTMQQQGSSCSNAVLTNVITSKNNNGTTVTIVPSTLIKTFPSTQTATTTNGQTTTVSVLQQQQQCRPGVIVVKQNS